jgi:3-oxocholest-4-en-26-oyl-CoA dehydrogenase beta subunit
VDFGFTEEQEEIRALARRILQDKVTEEVLRRVEADPGSPGGERFDPATWEALARAGLLGVALPVEVGGGGCGVVERCIVLEEVGRAVAPVPVAASSVLGAAPIARFGDAGQQERWARPAAEGTGVLTAALAEPTNRLPDRPTTTATDLGDRWRLDGTKTCVPAGTIADAVVVPATLADGTTAVFVVERGAAGLTVEPQAVTNRDTEARLTLDAVTVERDALLGGEESGDVLGWLVQHATVALCAQQLGVLSRALELTAEYTKQRVQFDRPIATFQAVGQRMADSYIDVEGLRLTLWQAAWRLDEGLPAATEVNVAKFWAAEAAHRVGHAAVHLHGGTGIADDYPLHRYFLAAKALEFALGGATDQLLRIGAAFAAARE